MLASKRADQYFTRKPVMFERLILEGARVELLLGRKIDECTICLVNEETNSLVHVVEDLKVGRVYYDIYRQRVSGVKRKKTIPKTSIEAEIRDYTIKMFPFYDSQTE